MTPRTVVVGTAGHIDHGKSSLVRALTGTDPDRLAEEKARGITIDLGFAHLDLEDVRVSFVDVPGHERFVKNMLAGATGLDAVLLVVAADESVMPQTREHFAICRLLGVGAGAIALTKSDLVDDEMLELSRIEVRELVKGSFLEDAPIVALSSTTGAGLDELRRVLSGLAGVGRGRAADAPPRLYVDRVFTVRGFGTVVTGTLRAGTVAVGDELELLPVGRSVKVRGLQAHGSRVEAAGPGQRLAINLAGVDVADVERGACVVAPRSYRPTRVFDVLLETLADAPALRHGARVRVHAGTSEVMGRLAVARIEAPDGAGTTVDLSAIPPASAAFGRLRVEAPLVLTRGDRLILRAYSPARTIAGGEVIDPAPPRGPTRSVKGQSRLAALDPRQAGADRLAVLQMIAECTGHGLDRAALGWRGGLTPAQASDLDAVLVGDGTCERVASLLVTTSTTRALEAALLRAVGDHHRANPLSDGLPREEARTRVFAHADDAVFAHVVANAVSTGALVGRDRLALRSFRVDVDERDRPVLDRLRHSIEQGGLQPPDLAAIAADTGVTVARLEQLAGLLGRQRVIVKLDALWFSASALDGLKAEVRALKGTAGGARLDVAAFKERYGMTRKFAIPLLEYLDRERVTRRSGDARVVL